MEVIDVHNHIFPDDVAEEYRENYSELSGMPFVAEPTIGGLLKCMERNRISKACALQEWQSTSPFESENLTFMCSSDGYYFYSFNSWLAGVQDGNPSVFCFGGVHPDEDDPEGSLQQIAEEYKLFGLKLIPCMQQYRLNDPRLMPVYRKAEACGLPILMHTGFDPILGMEDYGHPRDAGEVAQAFPGLTIIMAHMGMPFFDETREVIEECENVYTDVAATIDLLDVMELSSLIREVGVERVLFGSDFPFCDTRESLQKMEELKLSSEEREMILGKNARRILGL